MSIGWVIFWKSVVMTLWSAFAARWDTYREQRMADGIPLRFSSKSNSYVVFDWTEKVQNAGRIFRKSVLILLYSWWAICAFLLLTGQGELLGELVWGAPR